MKAFYKSKTLWFNILSIVALFIQTQTAFIIDPQIQAGIMAAVNFGLRFVTDSPVGKVSK